MCKRQGIWDKKQRDDERIQCKIIIYVLNYFCFELDSKLVVDSFHSTTLDYSCFRAIVSHSKNLASSYFSNSWVEYNRRLANEASHSLARAALCKDYRQVFDVPPFCIQNIIIMK